MTISNQIDTGTDDELLLRLWPSAATVGEARHAVGQFCRDGRHDVLADDAELLTSELMSNACRHTAGLITLLALRNTKGLVVTVSDDNVLKTPLRAMPHDPDRVSGRGLLLVDTIAGAWGTAPHVDGKSVWFRLP